MAPVLQRPPRAGSHSACQTRAPAPRVRCSLGRQRSTGQPPTRLKRACRAQEADVQVFRFTLGIPGFDDRYIPRVVGVLGALLIAVNHSSSSTPLAASQSRAEVIGGILALLCSLLPTIETALLEASGNVGRREASATVAGSTSAFVFDRSLPEAAAKELAWASFACLRNTNTSALLVLQAGGRVALARGALGAAVAPAAGDRPDFDSVAAVVQTDVDASGALDGLPDSGLLLRSRGAMRSRGVGAWASVPEGCQTAMLVPLRSGGAIVALSEFEDGFPSKDVAWLRSVAAKLSAVLT